MRRYQGTSKRASDAIYISLLFLGANVSSQVRLLYRMVENILELADDRMTRRVVS